MSGIFSAGGAGNVGVSGFYPTQINDSLRFEDGSSAYLNRTPSSAGNRRTWTWSAWIKRGNTDTTNSQYLFSAYGSGTNYTALSIGYSSDDDIFRFEAYDGGSNLDSDLRSVRVLRDVSSWYHIVLAVDTTQSTSSNRVKIYINGDLQTSYTTQTFMAQNFDTAANSGVSHQIGSINSGYHFDGYMADVYMIDGQALDATSFGEAKDGTWIPKSYSGSYGTNGFHLEFNGNTNDTSGNSNNWTANNISAHDYVPDSPTNNFATLTPLVVSSSITLAEGNLKATTTNTSSSHQAYSAMNIPTSGKWYFECYAILPRADDLEFGISDIPTPDDRNANHLTTMPYYLSPDACAILNTTANNLMIRQQSGTTTMVSGISGSTGDIYQIAFDCDTGKVFLGRNNTYYRVGAADGNPSSGTNPSKTITANKEYCIGLSCFGASGAGGGIINYGQDSTFAGNTTAGGNSDANGVGDFKYAPPSGYLALCTANLPEPTIIDGSENFTTMLHTGTGSQQVVTGAGFAPDFRWTKSRDSAYSHILHDNVRGETKYLQSNNPNPENTLANMSLDSDGFTVHADDLNDPQVSWLWKAGGTAVSNTAGSITSQVSANVDAGFSIVSWTGTGSAATIGHSLGVQPSMIIVKNRIDGRNWSVWHKDLSSNDHYLRLDSTDDQASAGANYWNSTAPTSSVFSVGVEGDVNDSDDAMIAYCFANVDGYSKVGSYIGGGSNFPFVYTGFRPAWIMIKGATVASHWLIFDATRHPSNVNDLRLFANLANGDDSAYALDLLSNGFKLRHTGADFNGSGHTYIYLAFAENPINYANAR